MKYKFYIYILLLALLQTSCKKRSLPDDLKKYGVVVTWKCGNTPSYDHIEVTSNYGDCPILFGGILDAELYYDDVDSDGVSDIVFGSKTSKQIVTIDEKSKTWRILRNDMEHKLFAK